MFLKQISNSLEIAAMFGEINIDKAETTLKKLSEGKGTAKLLQICSAKNIVSHFHVFAAAEQAFSSTENHTSKSNSAEIEFLCRLNAESQIEKAIDASALKKGKNIACIVVICKKGSATKHLQDAALKIGLKEKKIDLSKNANAAMRHFGITKKELEALSDLENPLEAAVLEKMALASLSQ
jgi:tRNA threonylcarbamoyladenosine modification (KEOPS) complex Cgi121 subunit